MEHSPLISVVIPAYNAERWLRRCLDSVCNQTYQNLEILCVNDASTDGTLAILREYEAKDERVRVLDMAHAGAGAARNAALDVARGEWVTGVDADDWLVPDAYERLLSRELDGVDVVAYEAETVMEDEPTWGEWNYALEHEGTRPMTNADILVLRAGFVLKLHRRRIIEQYGLRFPEGHIYEDEPFHLLFLAHARSICYVRESLYRRSVHRSSVMQQAEREAFEDVSLVHMEGVFSHFVSHGLLEMRWPALWDYLVSKCLAFAEQNKEGEALRLWKREVLELARRSGVLRNRNLAWLLDSAFSTARQGWLSRLFVKKKPGSLSVRFLGIPLLKVRRRERETVYLVLGGVVRREADPL